MSSYLISLTRAVSAMHDCVCSHVSTTLVHEMADGKTIWQGRVETLVLTGHPTASRAFAWGYNDENGEIQYSAVLNVPPINSPRDAVLAAITSRCSQV